MKKALFAAGIALASTVALAACGRDEKRDPRGIGRDETLVSVTGTGRAESRPDQAIFTAGLEVIGADATDASARTNAAVARIVTALKATGVAERDIQTSSLSIARIDYGRNRGRFQASNTVTVKVRQVDKAGAAIAAATAAGANVLSGPTLSQADPEAAALSANGNAYRAARAKAEAYANAAGLKVVRVVSIGDAGAGLPVTMQEEAMDRMAMRAPQAIQAAPVMVGTNTATVTVRVDFALGPK